MIAIEVTDIQTDWVITILSSTVFIVNRILAICYKLVKNIAKSQNFARIYPQMIFSLYFTPKNILISHIETKICSVLTR